MSSALLCGAGARLPVSAPRRPTVAHFAVRHPSSPLLYARPLAKRRAGRQGPAVAAAQAPPSPPDPPAEGGGWRTFWAAVDTSAWLGTVGSAVAFIVTQEAMLAAAPVVLPLLALYASRQRERLAAAASQQAQLRRLERLLLDLQVETADEVAGEVAAEVAQQLQQLQQAIKQGAAGVSPADVSKILRGLDAKLSSMEGSVLGAGSSTAAALQQSAEQQAQLSDRVLGRLQDLGTALRRDINGALQQAGSQDAAALGQLEARLASLEGAIGQLQGAQSDGLMRLNSGLQLALTDAEASLQQAVREEAYRSLDPLRRLPELLREAMPVMPEVLDRSQGSMGDEALRQLLDEVVTAASRDMLAQQAALLEELAARPQGMPPEQWSQLGGRLSYLKDQLQELTAAQQAAAAAGPADEGGGGAATAGIAVELAGLRSELGSLAALVQQLAEAQSAAAAAAAAAPRPVGGASLPPDTLASVAAAIQVVQDQVALLRQDSEEEDPRYASIVALERQLEPVLVALYEALKGAGDAPAGRVAGPSGLQAPAAAAPQPDAASLAAAERQAAALVAAVESLAGLEARLDGMSRQLAGLQAGLAAVPPPPAQPAAPAAQQAPAADPAQPGQRSESQLAAAAEAEGDAGAAFRRMQALLQQRPERGAAADAEQSMDQSGGKAFAEWLAGHRDNGVPAAVPAASGSSSNSANGSVGGRGNGSGAGVQQQIEFAAAMGLVDEDEAAFEQAAAAGEAAAQPGSSASERPAEQPQAAAQQSAAAAEGQQAAAWLQQPSRERQAWDAAQAEQQSQEQQAVAEAAAAQLYERGVQRLREGRSLAATPGADLAAADAALWEAADSFEQLLAQHDPANIRARGNYGNALLSHGRLKKQMLDALAPTAALADPAQAAALAATQQQLAGDAQELLLLAGRQYRAVLEVDPSQAKAFINWGRVIGLRADMARAAGDVAEGGRLFLLSTDKFDAALDLEPQNVQALRLGGQAVLDAALCLLGEDPREATALLKDAATYLEAALGLDPSDAESAAALDRCRQQLTALRQRA